MKKLNTLIAVMLIVFAVSALKAQTYPVPKFSIQFHGGYTTTLPDLKGTYPDLVKDPEPYYINNGFNFGAGAKYYIDKKSTFGVVLNLTYSMLSSGNIAVNNADTLIGTGTWRTNMNLFTLGIGAEYAFAPKRPANPFVNVQFTTNFISGNTKFVQDGASTPNRENFDNTMTSAVRFGAMFGAGVDVKLSKTVGVVIGGRYAFANLFGKDYTANTTTTYGLNDKESTNPTMKSRKMPYLQFYAGVSLYFGMKDRVVKK